MKKILLTSLLSLLLVVGISGLPSITTFAQETTEIGTNPPVQLLAGLNIAADDESGLESRALFLINPDTEEVWNFPLTTIDGGAVLGQGMHVAITPDRQQIFFTMGGNEELPLRLETFNINWQDGQPSLNQVSDKALIPANTENVFGWGSDEPSAMQEGHGLNIDPTGKYAMWSNLNNHTVQTLRLADNELLTDPIADETVYTPHGLFSNPSGTMAVTPNYAYGNQTATVWTLEEGIPSFASTVKMENDQVKGAWPHMAEWINDEQFLLPAGHETIDAPINTYQAGLWLCSVNEDTCQSLMNETTEDAPEAGVIKGVSDLVWKSNEDGTIRVYVGEGNFLQQDIKGGPVPGYISIWNVDPVSGQPAQFVKRLSAGDGLPEDFRDVHGMCRTSTHGYIMSFASNYMLELDLDKDEISNIYNREDDLIVPHGVACSG